VGERAARRAPHPADHPGPLVFVDDLDVPLLSAGDQHHLERVLRLRVGDGLTVADGRGRWRRAELAADRHPTPIGEVITTVSPDPTLAVGFALVKGDKPEVVVQKLTELGIDRIVPFRSERSVVRWDDAKAAKAVTRLRAVARSAAMQCHRPQLPEVLEVADLADLRAEPGAVMADRAGERLRLEHQLVLVGPEGGWATAEQALDLPRVALGGHVLRAETAAITAGALLAALRAQLVRPA
jgi:16S rRNA (uracil1498-N3)-methyltransferase